MGRGRRTYRSVYACLALLLSLMMSSGGAAQNSTNAPSPASVQSTMPAKAVEDTAAEIQTLRTRAESAERNEAIAAVKVELMNAGNSRLDILIGGFALLITALLAAFGFATYKTAATAARQEVSSMRAELETMRNEARVFRDEAKTLRDAAKSHAGEIEQTRDKVLELSDELKARVQQTPSTRSESPLPAAEKAELDRAADSVEAIPPGERTAQEFRVLMLRAEQQENWQDYIALAEGMAYLHGDKPEDLAFALFARAFGHLELENYELSASLWADYFTRCSDDQSADHANGYYNWGNVLLQQATSKHGDAADVLIAQAGEKFAQAGEKYAAALMIEPKDHEMLATWGDALVAQAKTKQGDAAERLFAQAGEKYAAALTIKPDYHKALNNWAGALFELAKTKQGDAADVLFTQAVGKLAAMLKIKPDLREAYYNWGTALMAHAQTKQGEAADRLFAQAEEKYAAALTIKPDDHMALNNWAGAILEQALTKQDDAAAALLADAESKLQQAEALMPGAGAYNLACVCGLRGDAAGTAQWLRTAKKLKTNFTDCAHIATDKVFNAVRDRPEFIAALSDIGCAPQS
jgi:Plant specific mitochondrial import receptor subunit TOM20